VVVLCSVHEVAGATALVTAFPTLPTRARDPILVALERVEGP
jgi:hypothetical protein